jgi:carbamoylphosphate synthase large subunit
MDQKKTVLVGSCGAGNAFSSLLALRRNWGNTIKIVAIDINPGYLVTSSLISDKYFQVPETRTSDFKEYLLDILINEDVDTYIPLMDDEIFVAAKLYEEGRFNEKLSLQVKNSKIANLCNDKYETFNWLTEHNILTPLCFKEIEPKQINEKLIIKPRRGFGSKIIRLSDFNNTSFNYNFEDFIIQQECDNPEVTIDVCFDKKNEFFCYICRERLEVKSGVCTKARLFYDKSLEKIALIIADNMGLNSFCFQVMKYMGEWAVTDINARLGAGTAMDLSVGMDFFSGMFAILWGENPSEYFRPLQNETFVTRQYSDFLMKM